MEGVVTAYPLPVSKIDVTYTLTDSRINFTLAAGETLPALVTDASGII